MKTILLSALLFCSFFIQSNAQVTFGIKGGIGLSRLSYRSINEFIHSGDEKGFMVVPSIYGVVTVPISNSFLIRTGIGFNQQAYSYVDNHIRYTWSLNRESYNDEVKARLTYLGIPLSISYKLPLGQRKFELFAGGSFGLNLGGRAEINTKVAHNAISTGGYSYTEDRHYDVNVRAGDVPGGYIQYGDYIYTNKYNFSMLFGANYQLNKSILLGLESRIGISNAHPHNYNVWWGSTDEDQRKAKTTIQSYMLTVTYIFGQGKKVD